ncbi:MAG TPA: hypothetical protein VMH41_12100 [Mycobacteriales bacterium]|nr:hypothetical protein [Mycobacteriales bacterium]
MGLTRAHARTTAGYPAMTEFSAAPVREDAADLGGADLPLVRRLIPIALLGIRRSYDADRGVTVFTRRRSRDTSRVMGEGTSVRYTAMAALGLSRRTEAEQREALRGLTAAELMSQVVDRSPSTADLGDLSSICWAAAELGVPNASEALMRLLAALRSAAGAPTVHVAWALTALIASRASSLAEVRTEEVRDRLLTARSAGRDLFGHAVDGGRFVGCFADQVYPIQALARHAQVTGDERSLAAAAACAEAICALQGPGGQWWWHYDSRRDTVLEGYPVYSVHQHAMAPMALHDLYAAGGGDYRAQIDLGLRWLETTPERQTDLIDGDLGVVWRKIGRREYPRKAVRGIKAAVRRYAPSAPIPLIDRLAPPVSVDWECRPYELGWLLYAWSGKWGVPDGDLGR